MRKIKMILLLLLMMARFPSGCAYFCFGDDYAVSLKDYENEQFSLDSTILNQYLQYTDVNECIIEKCGCVFDEAALNDSWTPEQVNYCILAGYSNPFDTPYSTIYDSLGYLWDELNINELPKRVPVLGNGSHFFSLAQEERENRYGFTQDCDNVWYEGEAHARELVLNRTIYKGYVSPICLRERLVKQPNLRFFDSASIPVDTATVFGQISAQSTCRKLCEASAPLALEADLEAAGVLKVTSGKCTSITYEECNSLRTQFANTEDVSNGSNSDDPNGCFLVTWSNKLSYNTEATTTECKEGKPCLCSDCPAGHYIRGGKCVACDTCGDGRFIKHGTCSGRRNSVCLDCPTDVPWASTPQTLSWASSVGIPYYRMSNFNDENSCFYMCPDGMWTIYYDTEAVPSVPDLGDWGPMRCLPSCTEGAIDCADGTGAYCAFYLNGTCVSECPLIVNGTCVQKTKEWLEDEYKLLSMTGLDISTAVMDPSLLMQALASQQAGC